MAVTREYIPPPLEGAPPPSLVPVDAHQHRLTPETEVTCINRSSQVLLAQSNGQHYEIPPGMFRCRYADAKLFQARLIVPGTRAGLLGRGGSIRAESYIGILGIDPPEKCQPLTPARERQAAETKEAFDRSTMESPSARTVRRVKTADVRGKVPGQAATRANFAARQVEDQATEEARERARTAFVPPKGKAPEPDDDEV
jgi:hypothetical protein